METSSKNGQTRVIMLLDRLGSGGAAQVVINTALSLNRQKYYPIVCITRQAEKNDQDILLHEAKIAVVELERRHFWEIWRWFPLWQILPDATILHSHSSGSNAWARIWGKFFRVPVVIAHDHRASDQKTKIMRLIDRWMGFLSDRIVAVSHFDRQLLAELENHPPAKVLTIYNGVDTTRFNLPLSQAEARERAGFSQDKLLVAIVARLSPQKSHNLLLKALTLLPDDLRHKVQCLIVGDGILKTEIQEQVSLLGLEEQVSILGHRNDIPMILKAVDLLTLSSQWECLPVILLEGLAAGCPMVSTRVGGVPEILDDVGWPTVMPGDAEGLARAIETVLRMPTAEKEKLAAKGREISRLKFSKERSASEVERMYDALLEEKGRSTP